jgi:hypothetical protein
MLAIPSSPFDIAAYLLLEENRTVTEPLPGNSTGPDVSITTTFRSPERVNKAQTGAYPHRS